MSRALAWTPWRGPGISPGQSGMLMVTLQKGFCGLGCPVPGHEDKSMSLTIEAG